MFKHLFVISASALTLVGCDAASDIAGDAVQGELRNIVATQCQQVAEGAGIAAARIGEVCQCSANTFMDDPDLNMDDVSRERIEGIVNDCAASIDGAANDSTQIMPAEEIGG